MDEKYGFCRSGGGGQSVDLENRQMSGGFVKIVLLAPQQKIPAARGYPQPGQANEESIACERAGVVYVKPEM